MTIKKNKKHDPFIMGLIYLSYMGFMFFFLFLYQIVMVKFGINDENFWRYGFEWSGMKTISVWVFGIVVSCTSFIFPLWIIVPIIKRMEEIKGRK